MPFGNVSVVTYKSRGMDISATLLSSGFNETSIIVSVRYGPWWPSPPIPRSRILTRSSFVPDMSPLSFRRRFLICERIPIPPKLLVASLPDIIICVVNPTIVIRIKTDPYRTIFLSHPVCGSFGFESSKKAGCKKFTSTRFLFSVIGFFVKIIVCFSFLFSVIISTIMRFGKSAEVCYIASTSMSTEFLENSQSVSMGDKTSKWRSVLEFVVELVRVTVICAVIIISVRWFLFQPFYVNGSSMEPNFYDGEYLIIYQLPYRFPNQFDRFTEENRGQTLIFRPPNALDQFYIKRLIGLPGEEVEIKEGKVIVYNDHFPDGFQLEEHYIPFGMQTLTDSHDRVRIGQDEIFVLGDNRTRSLDSRRIGAVPIKNVVGRPVIRGWPITRVGVIK